MSHPSDDLIDTLSASLCLLSYPHKEWRAMSEEERGWWRQDTLAMLQAITAAGYELIPLRQPRLPLLYSNEDRHG